MEHDMARARRVFDAVGIEARDSVIFTFSAAEEGQFWPFQAVAVERGVTYASAEPSEFDAARVRMFGRTVEPKAVLGVTAATLDGLAALETPLVDVFGSIPVVYARPGAASRLVDAGVPALLCAIVGPAVASECAPGAGAHLPPGWSASANDGELLITAPAERALALSAQPTGLRGRVETAACECGLDEPRVFVEGA
jgi:hypothetical protein